MNQTFETPLRHIHNENSFNLKHKAPPKFIILFILAHTRALCQSRERNFIYYSRFLLYFIENSLDKQKKECYNPFIRRFS